MHSNAGRCLGLLHRLQAVSLQSWYCQCLLSHPCLPLLPTPPATEAARGLSMELYRTQPRDQASATKAVKDICQEQRMEQQVGGGAGGAGGADQLY